MHLCLYLSLYRDVPRVSNFWCLPAFSYNFHQGRLFVWKSNFLFLVEPDILEVIDEPVGKHTLATTNIFIERSSYFSLSTLGSSNTLWVLKSANQQ